MIISLYNSRILTGLFLLNHLGAAAVLFLLPLNGLLKFGFVLALGWSLYRALVLHALRSDPRAVRSIRFGNRENMHVCRADGTWQACRPVAGVHLPGGLLLRFQSGGRRLTETLVIAADAVEDTPFRQLRAQMRLPARAGRVSYP